MDVPSTSKPDVDGSVIVLIVLALLLLTTILVGANTGLW